MPATASENSLDAAAKAEIGALLARAADAIRLRNADAAMACYTGDIVSFSLAPPLASRGAAEIRADLDDWFATWTGPIETELRDLEITAGEGAAFATCLTHLSGEKTDGAQPALWFRTTYGLRKEDGNWKIAHEHASTPFHMDGSFKAAVGLKP